MHGKPEIHNSHTHLLGWSCRRRGGTHVAGSRAYTVRVRVRVRVHMHNIQCMFRIVSQMGPGCSMHGTPPASCTVEGKTKNVGDLCSEERDVAASLQIRKGIILAVSHSCRRSVALRSGTCSTVAVYVHVVHRCSGKRWLARDVCENGSSESLV